MGDITLGNSKACLWKIPWPTLLLEIPKFTENPMADITLGNSKACLRKIPLLTSLSELLRAEWVWCVTQSRYEVEAWVRLNAGVLLRRPPAAAASPAADHQWRVGGSAGGRRPRNLRPAAPPARRESCCRLNVEEVFGNKEFTKTCCSAFWIGTRMARNRLAGRRNMQK